MVIVTSARARKGVTRLGVFVNDHALVSCEGFLHLGGYLRARVGILARIMEHHPAGKVLGEIQVLLDSHSVVADRRIRLVAHRGEVRNESAPAVADDAYASRA